MSGMTQHALTRRKFLALSAGAPLALDSVGMRAAAAQGASDYKALVCVYLEGGNDAINTVLATDAASWSRYAALRRQGAATIGLMPPGAPGRPTAPGTNRKLGGVLPIVPLTAQPGRSFALHPAMTAMRDLFVARRAAIVANVGALVVPTGKAEYCDNSVPLPPRLRSHEARLSVWRWFAQQSTGIGAALVNPLAERLQLIARAVSAAQSVPGVRRQVFFVRVGGWDFHSAQNDRQADLLARLSHALDRFDRTLRTLPDGDLSATVTTFTASDFGRTIDSNGDGTDHGWGAHHFVVGGAVRGGDIYGRFPEIGVSDRTTGYDNPDEVDRMLLPEISVDQYGATLARWFGLGEADLLGVFPNLKNFDPARRDLGFMA